MILQHCITNLETNLRWFILGTTYLQLKSYKTKIPKNYRPITCLSTMNKILISIVTERHPISWTQITSYHLNKKDVKMDPMASKTSC